MAHFSVLSSLTHFLVHLYFLIFLQYEKALEPKGASQYFW